MDINTCDPSKLSLKEKIKLIHETDGFLIDILEGEIIEGNLYLNNCTSLTYLPENLEIEKNLFLDGCTSLIHLPDDLKIGGSLWLKGCTSIENIPDSIWVKWYICLPEHLKYKIFEKPNLKRGLHEHKYM